MQCNNLPSSEWETSELIWPGVSTKKGTRCWSSTTTRTGFRKSGTGSARAIVADATDPKVLASLDLDQMDAVTVSVGDNIAAAILITLNLKDINVKRLAVKTVSEPQGRVLQKVGATEVLFPEKDMALTLAERLHSPNVLEYLPFMEDYSIIEMTPPAHTVGKPLRELDLINRYGIQIIAIKEIAPERMNMVPTATYVMKDSDILIVLGSREGIEKMRADTA